jgi:hypothetical protein
LCGEDDTTRTGETTMDWTNFWVLPAFLFSLWLTAEFWGLIGDAIFGDDEDDEPAAPVVEYRRRKV